MASLGNPTQDNTAQLCVRDDRSLGCVHRIGLGLAHCFEKGTVANMALDSSTGFFIAAPSEGGELDQWCVFDAYVKPRKPIFFGTQNQAEHVATTLNEVSRRNLNDAQK